MLNVLTVSVLIGKAHGQELPRCVAALNRAVRFLNSMIIHEGRQPRYGHDDGACFLDWTSCERDDFRPTLQESAFAAGMPLPLSPGPWDGGLGYLGAKQDCLERQPITIGEPRTIHRHAGIAIIRSSETPASDFCATIRLPNATFRPGQVDAMHTDIWFHGCPIAIDPGTYRYNADEQWSTIPLAQGSAHNVVTDQTHDLATRMGRFLYIPWPSVTIDPATQPNEVSATFDRPIGRIESWKRQLSVQPDEVHVVDTLHCKPDCSFRLRWQLADGPLSECGESTFRWRTAAGMVRLDVDTQGASNVNPMTSVRAGADDQNGSLGWFAPTYGQLSPCHTVTVEGNSGTPNDSSGGVTSEVILSSKFTIEEVA